MQFGERLRALRSAQGRTLSSVSLAARMSRGYLSKIETGTEKPPGDKLIRRLCTALRCETELPMLLELAKVSRALSDAAGEFQGMHFGKRLRMLRRERGSTMQQVSDAIDISPTYLEGIERGKSNPPDPDVIKQICAVLGCDAELPNLLELARAFRPHEAFVMRTNLHTDPEIKQMMGLLQSIHAAGKLTPTSARAIVEILEGETTRL